MADQPRILVIVGPTAAGKSELAVDLALQLDGEIISADSMQVYRRFNIGTGKLSLEQRRGVPHHLIDIIDAWKGFSAARFVERADRLIAQIARRGRLPIVVGGTGLYVRALLRGLIDAPPYDAAVRQEHERICEERGLDHLYQQLRRCDPEAADSIDPNDFMRISRALDIYSQTGMKASELRRRHAFSARRHDAVIVGLRVAPEQLKQRIARRVDRMLESGWLEEVAELCERGYRETPPMRALGYRQLGAHLSGELDLEQAVRKTKRDTWRFSRRQRNWFSQEPGVIWVDDPGEIDVDDLARRLGRSRRSASG